MYVNAVTGKVWSAEINLQQALPMEMSRNRLRKFVLLSGVEPSDAESEGEWKSEDKDKERAGYRNLEISHSRLYARELWYTNEAFPHSGENNQELVNLQEMLNLYLHEEEPISKAAPF